MMEFLATLHYFHSEQVANGYKPTWVYHQLEQRFDIGRAELEAIAELLDFKAYWVTCKLRDLQQESQEAKDARSAQYGRHKGDKHHKSVPQHVREALSLLQLNLPISEPKLKDAYRRCALHTHPDAGGCNALFIQVNDAYETLKLFVGVGGAAW